MDTDAGFSRKSDSQEADSSMYYTRAEEDRMKMSR